MGKGRRMRGIRDRRIELAMDATVIRRYIFQADRDLCASMFGG